MDVQTCGCCGRPDSTGLGETCWFASNDLWNEIEGGPGGFRCPECFTADATEKGIAIEWKAGVVGELGD